jgi:hypothetical protein
MFPEVDISYDARSPAKPSKALDAKKALAPALASMGPVCSG